MSITIQYRNTLYILGYLFLRMGRWQQAGRVFNALAALDPEDQWAQRNLAVLALEKKNGQQALQHLEKACAQTELAAHDPLQLVRAKALYVTGQQEEARKVMAAYLVRPGGVS